MIWEAPLKRILLLVAIAAADLAQFRARDDVRQILSDCPNENSVDLDALIREITP